MMRLFVVCHVGESGRKLVFATNRVVNKSIHGPSCGCAILLGDECCGLPLSLALRRPGESPGRRASTAMELYEGKSAVRVDNFDNTVLTCHKKPPSLGVKRHTRRFVTRHHGKIAVILSSFVIQ